MNFTTCSLGRHGEFSSPNAQLVNKKETYTCEEKDNVFVQFITDEKYHQALTLVFITLLENL